MALHLDALLVPIQLIFFQPLLNLAHLVLFFSGGTASHYFTQLPELIKLLQSPFLLGLSALSLSLAIVHWSAQAWRDGSLLPPARLGTQEWGQQIAVVTGGSGGLGASISQALLKKGAKVAILDVVAPPSHASTALFIKCDIRSKASIDEAAHKIRSELGDPTIVINNAGVQHNKLLVDLSEAELDLTFDINLKSHYLTLQAFLPAMLKAERGHIVTTISALGYVGVSRLTDYCASKHALIGFVESLRYELDKVYRTPQIRTTNLILGQLRTPLFATYTPPNSFAGFLSPVVEPDEVARRVVEAVERRQSRWIMLPAYVNMVPFFKALPSWARDVAQMIGGADESSPEAKAKSS